MRQMLSAPETCRSSPIGPRGYESGLSATHWKYDGKVGLCGPTYYIALSDWQLEIGAQSSRQPEKIRQLSIFTKPSNREPGPRVEFEGCFSVATLLRKPAKKS